MKSRYNKISGIHWKLIDKDKQALAYARQNIPRREDVILNFISAGIVDIISRNVPLIQQDIIYSLGLLDYLEDKIAIKLLKSLYKSLKPGGTLLMGNFSRHHSLQLLMEVFSNWKLIYREEEQLFALGKEAAPQGRHFVMAEPEGINLILVTSKPAVENRSYFFYQQERRN
ncbi:MAG: class I SAM-dependent methyltransferase [bacterium]|nr:class I SAM-dependent methyltransferase [bacterium]